MVLMEKLGSFLNGIGVDVETWLVLLILLGSVLFFAYDIRVGLVFLFVVLSGLFVGFYLSGLQTSILLILLILLIVVMAFTLLISFSKSGGQQIA